MIEGIKSTFIEGVTDLFKYAVNNPCKTGGVAALILAAYKNTHSYTPTGYKKLDKCLSSTINTLRIMACAISTLQWAGEKNDPTFFGFNMTCELIIYSLGKFLPNIKETTYTEKELQYSQKLAFTKARKIYDEHMKNIPRKQQNKWQQKINENRLLQTQNELLKDELELATEIERRKPVPMEEVVVID